MMKCTLTQKRECFEKRVFIKQINQSLRRKGIDDKYVKQSIEKIKKMK